MTRWRAAFALALLLAGCGARDIPARPALWRVQDADTTIWLLGAIHAMPPGVAWRTPAVRAAMAQADTLILEIPPADAATARAGFAAVATAPGLAPLLDRVPPAERAALARAVAAAGQAPGALDRYKTWAAALLLTAGAGGAHGATGDNGVEPVVTAAFAGRTIGALETQAGQLALFDRLPAPAQTTLLLQAVRDTTQREDPTFAAWARGDEPALAATLAPLATQPTLERALLTDRNARWTAAIAHRLARPGRVLMVVGAGHLVSPHSVVALLRARGIGVTRIE